MKITRWLVCAAALFLGGQYSNSAANAQEAFLTEQPRLLDVANAYGIQQVNYNEFNAEARIAELESRLASLENSNHGGGGGGCDTCCEPDCWLNPACGVYGEAQLVFLRAQDSEADNFGTEYSTGSRWTAGYMFNNGQSFRLRYFEYATTIVNGPVELETLDLEYAARFRVGGVLRGEFSAGARYASFHEDGDMFYRDSIGLVVGMELRGLQIRCWDTFATARHSFQFGEEVNNGFGSFSVTEIQMGLIREFETNFGTGYVQALVEADYWSGPADGNSEDLGLIGYGFGIGFRR